MAATFNESNTNVSNIVNNSQESVDNFTEFDDVTLLKQYLGDRYMPLWSLVLLNITYITIFVTGLVGNVCTCIVITRNRNMHTATNYYLFSLAISDVLILILALPPELYTFWEAYPWRLGQYYCILKSYIQEVTSYASVLTIATFTIERYLAICHPMTSQIFNSPSRAVKLIIVQWLIACLSALPYAIYTRTFYVVHRPWSDVPIKRSLMCNIPIEFRDTMTYWFQVSSFVFFVYPMSVILVMYVLIGLKLSKSDMVADRNNVATVKARKCVIKMLVGVVVAFFVCWAPFHAQRLMTIYIDANDWTPTLIEAQNHIFLVSGVLYFVSSTVNPILYNALSLRYRRAFIKTILPCIKVESSFLSASTFNSNNSQAANKSSPYLYRQLNTRPNTPTPRASHLLCPRTEGNSPV